MSSHRYVLVFQTKESEEFYNFFSEEEKGKDALREILLNEEYNHVGLFKIEKEIKL